MNKQTTNKLELFLTGLTNRFEENVSIFKSVEVNFTAGLKTFSGNGVLQEGLINFNFNGKSDTLSIENLFANILDTAKNYDSATIVYAERSEILTITASEKNVKMNTSKVEVENESSPRLRRDYYIKVGQADPLLKELGILTNDGKIKNDKIRKYNQIDHYVELMEGILDTLPKNQTINILDCGCGKSYLTFVLNYYLTEVKKRRCHFIGLDRSETVIEASKKMAANLDYRNMEFHALDIKEYSPRVNIDVVISLHACDTATDMALALGIRLQSKVIIAVPCCHKELLSQYDYKPFKSLLKYGVFKARMADIITDSMRSLFLEAKGYEVSAVEYISPLETPKNIMIRAVKTCDEKEESLDEYLKLMSELNVYPSLYDLVENQ
jgi:SAM-dependent methyltransferase